MDNASNNNTLVSGLVKVCLNKVSPAASENDDDDDDDAILQGLEDAEGEEYE